MYGGREGPSRSEPDESKPTLSTWYIGGGKCMVAEMGHRVLSQTRWRWGDVTMRCRSLSFQQGAATAGQASDLAPSMAIVDGSSGQVCRRVVSASLEQPVPF